MKTQDYANSTFTSSSRLFGTDATGQTKNFTVGSLLAILAGTSIPQVVATNGLTFHVITTNNTYFTGTPAGSAMIITLPPPSPFLDGMKYVIMSTQARLVTIQSVGATIVANYSQLTQVEPLCYQYNHSNTTWYPSL